MTRVPYVEIQIPIMLPGRYKVSLPYPEERCRTYAACSPSAGNDKYTDPKPVSPIYYNKGRGILWLAKVL